MANGGFISYLRVSTGRQGASGLGLQAQREAVRSYLNGGDWSIVGEFVEVESGRKADRPVLAQALAAARLHRVPLVVAKVDRLTRSLAFLTRLVEAGVDVRFCDLPEIEGPTGRFMLQQMAAVAELEAGMIGRRTRDALAAAKARGRKLGGRRVGQRLTNEMRAAGRAARVELSRARAADLAPIIGELRRAGITTLGGIARELTARRIPTARGGKKWAEVQVARVLSKLNGR
jgi:DNA invertase Pin-like site-specific DNA recombinase